jgi:sulfatase maturation enzyme AslB (radical SAM superfamily)
MEKLQVVVSIDGLQPEHDVRRAPATYDRILKHIAGQQITVHCTLTRQLARPGYVTTFTEFWAASSDVKRIWFSLYTPQKGEDSPERLRLEDRALFVEEISHLHARELKLHDMNPAVVQGYLRPPQNSDECVFSKTTECLSADLKKVITPCQYGGNPDCTQCGCMASVGLQALGEVKAGGVISLKSILEGSLSVGRTVRRFRESVGTAQ